MIITLDLTWFLNFLPYFMVGIGIGIACFYGNNSSIESERKKHDLQVKKEWVAMLSEQKKEKSKLQRWNNNARRN